MKMINVITPFSRYHLLPELIPMFEKQNIQWHIICDELKKDELSKILCVDMQCIPHWLNIYPIDETKLPKQFKWSTKTIEFMKTFRQTIVDDDYYTFFNDDDYYPQGFFDAIRKLDDDVIMVTLKRGQHIPPDSRVPHAITDLVAAPGNMKYGFCGPDSYIIKGKVLKQLEIPCTYSWDGVMAESIMKMVESQGLKISYHPELYVKFNYFEKGRWDPELPQGWFTDEDIKEYRRLVELVLDGGTICELGCWKGRSICSVADIIIRKKLNVMVVDTFMGNEGSLTCKVKDGEDIQKEFLNNVEKFGLKVIWIKGTTNEAVKTINNIEFDLLFIDADHSYNAVKQDIENWKSKVKKGGVVSGHDYNDPQTRRAVDEVYEKVNVAGLIWSKQI
jgi:hypothetical protein